MSVFTDTWTPNSANTYSRNVSFTPKALEIDNFSAFFLYVPDADKYIAPNTIGVVIPLPHYRGQVVVQAVVGDSKYPTTDTGNLNSTVTIAASEDDNLTYQIGQTFNANIVNAVVINGTVAISGNVGITGPVTVNGSVSISGTTNVLVTNASITVTGTVAISGTANVNITNASIAVTGSVNATITNASIAVTGSVSISGTPAVTISGTPTVSISGTVTASISSGTVNIGTVSGNVTILPGVFALSGNGVTKVAVSGTAIVLHTTLACKVVMVKARSANSGTIYIGTSTVTNNETAGTGGLQMDPGDIIVFTSTDLGTIYINGTAGDGVSFMYWT